MTPDERLEAVAEALHRDYPLTVKSLHVARELAYTALCTLAAPPPHDPEGPVSTTMLPDDAVDAYGTPEAHGPLPGGTP